MRTKSWTSIAFSRDGLVNPEALEFFRARQVNTLVLFGDGSAEAFEHMRNFDYSAYLDNTSRLAVARLPLWDMRVVGPDGSLSAPQYVHSDANKIDWFCASICAPLVNLYMLDTASQSGTKVELQNHQVMSMVDMSLRFWYILRAAEDRLGFPAMAIDALTRWTRVLAPEHIDIPVLRKETGLETLDYNLATDLLSIEVAGEVFTVKLSVLDAFYTNHILPYFNKYQGRRYQLEVSILGISDPATPPQVMSYGQFGQALDQLQSLVVNTRITAEQPMDPEDLLAYSKKVKIDEESCLYGRSYQSFDDFLLEAKDIVVRQQDKHGRPTGSNDTSPQHTASLQAA